MSGRQNPDAPLESAFPEDGEARADAIDERIERLRRLHGWTSDTRVVSAQEVAAVVEAVDGPATKGPKSHLFLTYDHGGAGPREVEIEDDHYDIGSGEKARLRVLDPTVAARHCRIYRDGETFRVRDMNTQTGTWVNETRVPLSAPIADGDTFRCGDVAFAVRIAMPGAAPAPKPAPAAVATPAPVAAPAPVAPPVAPVAAAPAPSTPAATSSEGRAAPTGRKAMSGTPTACFIVYFDANGEEHEVELPQDRPLVVGRKSSADLRLQDHGISSIHAAFEWNDGEVSVRDLGSTNGTWVHGERVPKAVLADQDVVRLGLIPLRICFVGQAAAAPAPAPKPAARPVAAGPVDLAHAAWHLMYVNDKGQVAVATVSEREPCIVAGEGPAEIQVVGRGLHSEHIQFDWTSKGLEVIPAHRAASIYVNDAATSQACLENGDIVTAGGLVLRVVRGASGKAVVAHSLEAQHWARRFRQVEADLELLFVDPEAAGGRVELSIWGDGMAQVDLRTGGSHERFGAALDAAMLQVLLDAFRHAGFPELPAGIPNPDAAGPELCAFKADDRSSVILGDGLIAVSDAWREVRDLLRAFIDLVIG